MTLDKYMESIKELCEKRDVKNLYVFGSALRDDFNENSDLDLLVDFYSRDPIEYAENYFALKFDLEDLFKRPIDLLEQKALDNKFFIENVNHSKKIIYEK